MTTNIIEICSSGALGESLEKRRISNSTCEPGEASGGQRGNGGRGHGPQPEEH